MKANYTGSWHLADEESLFGRIWLMKSIATRPCGGFAAHPIHPAASSQGQAENRSCIADFDVNVVGFLLLADQILVLVSFSCSW